MAFDPLPSLRRLHPITGHLFGGNIQAVPDVDIGYGDDQGRQSGLVVMPRGFLPDVIGDRVWSIVEPRDGLPPGINRNVLTT